MDPVAGEIRRGSTLGYSSGHKRVWVICQDCREGRWVALHVSKRVVFTGRCGDCNRSVRGGNRLKTGGRWVTNQGYVMILLTPGDFFLPMSGKNGYVAEHRLVMAQSLGRCLHSWEIVHHRNHKRSDNALSNLQLVSDGQHKQISLMETRIRRLEGRVTTLEAENTLLRTQVRQEMPTDG